MKSRNVEEHAKNLYLMDEYISKNPSLHIEDSPRKVRLIIPLVDKVLGLINKTEINLLDVGGGAGLILDAISLHIEQSHSIKVNKFALDLSPGMLEIQKNRIPSLKKAINEDIRKTSFADKEMDIALMIDVLEHVPGPKEALTELNRISNFVIFRVPLESNLLEWTLNWVTWGKERRSAIETIGHINVYSFKSLKREIEEHTGIIMYFYFANEFEHYRSLKMSVIGRFVKFIASCVFVMSPGLCSLLFNDFVMILARCSPLKKPVTHNIRVRP
jgi:SAM-dependent methyltransferase